jgi:hypothetical protein
MELTELLVWGIAIAAAMVFQIVQKRRQERERAQQPPPSQLPDGLFQPPQQPVPGPAYTQGERPSALDEQQWGRGTQKPTPAPALEEIHWGRGAPVPEVPAPVAPLPVRGQHLPVPLSALHSTVPVAAQPPRVSQAWHPTRRTRSAFFRTRADVRKAVIGMTVLGPCRALAPYGQEPDAGAAPPPTGAREARS